MGFLPVPALEDRLGRLGLEAAQEVEEEEEGNDGEGDGWELPTVFTLPRHVKPEPGPDPAMQVHLTLHEILVFLSWIVLHRHGGCESG